MRRLFNRNQFLGHAKPGRGSGKLVENQDQVLINALMDNIPDNIYFKDMDSRFIRINKALARYFKLNDPGLAVGKTDFDFFTEEHARQAFEDEQIILHTGRTISREEKETWENMPDSWVSTIKMPLCDENGNIVGTFGISRNVTSRVLIEMALKEKNQEIEAQNEEYLQMNEELQQINEELSVARIRAEESDRLKTAFLHNISHEIRTPLNAIMGFSGLMPTHFNDKEKLEKYAQIINHRCTDLLDILEAVFDIARIESGQLHVNLEECNLNQLFSEVQMFFKDYQERTNKQHIELSFQKYDASSDMAIISDRSKLKQIFINLVGNAFKFTSKGKIQIGCELSENLELVFCVSDTGIGISNDKQKFIFERFAQIEQRDNGLFGGTGLGLAIVKGLTDLLGGEIWLESELGRGTTFYFTIPYIPAK